MYDRIANTELNKWMFVALLKRNLLLYPIPCLLALMLVALVIPIQSALALNSDREQNINIQADSAIVDDNTGITIYAGNVTIDQGTLHIRADEVRVIMSQREILQIIASMEPESSSLAHYEQMPENEEELVSADAKIITYFLQEERLHLAGSALLKQTNDVFKGELLYYDLVKGRVDLKGGNKDQGGRVNITLTPRPK